MSVGEDHLRVLASAGIPIRAPAATVRLAASLAFMFGLRRSSGMDSLLDTMKKNLHTKIEASIPSLTNFGHLGSEARGLESRRRRPRARVDCASCVGDGRLTPALSRSVAVENGPDVAMLVGRGRQQCSVGDGLEVVVHGVDGRLAVPVPAGHR